MYASLSHQFLNVDCGGELAGHSVSLSGVHCVERSWEKSQPLDYSENSKEVLIRALLNLPRHCLLFSSLKWRIKYYLQNWFPRISVPPPVWAVLPCLLDLGEFFSCIAGHLLRPQGILFNILLTEVLNHPGPCISSKSFVRYKGSVRGDGDRF